MFNWAPKRSPVLIRDAFNSDLLARLVREGSCQVMDVDRHTWSIKALLLTVFTYQRGYKLRHQYLGHYARLVGCQLVLSFRRNGHNLGAFKLRNPAVTTVSFQNGVDNQEQSARPFKNGSEITGPDVAFGFDTENLKWMYSSLARQPLVHGTGSLRSNLVPIRRHERPERVLMFLSQWRPMNLSSPNPEVLSSISRETSKLLPFLVQFCADFEFELVVLGCSKENQECEKKFFAGFIDQTDFVFRPKAQRDWTEAYRQVDSADVVVTVDSALGLEAVMRGTKTCFFTDLKGPEAPVFSRALMHQPVGPFWVNNGSLLELHRVLGQLVTASDADFSGFLQEAEWLGTQDPGLRRTRETLLEINPRLEDVLEPLSEAIFV